ncbi:hypothetical protein JG687_00015464 [Phytophthora cactorum]|uniref:Uncharacterized protein n=1 Tax=Phytophthora cactorum TaxID=29920 RepID=A0A8T1TXW6_9STRA|nr:hypothetical protein JG687_00015464 [Phytophthora cactorum]
MIRKSGYSLKGKTVAIRGDFQIFNPIEYMFGYVKRFFQRHYVESSGRDLLSFEVKTFRRFEPFNWGKCLSTVAG